MYQIVARQALTPDAFAWEVFAPDVAKAARPGQFVMLRLTEGGERVPLTIADHDPGRGTVTIVTQAVGKTTRQMRDLSEGDFFQDFAGPLGLPSELLDGAPKHVVLVGGGLGVAPIYPQLAALADAGVTTTAILAFRTKDLIFWRERFEAKAHRLVICTDDGSSGRAGLATDALSDVIGEGSVDRVIAVGPLPMMRACAKVTAAHDIPTVVSLNAIMVDGTGMCGACRVTVGGQTRFACVDGPEFDAHQVDFDALAARQRRFGEEEARSEEERAARCEVEQLLFVQGKRNYKKLKAITPEARPMPERDAAARASTFDEVNLGYGHADAMAEAERCLQCTRPTCIAGCPVSIDIPRFIRQLLVHDLEGARDTIFETNLFPSICGRVCPQESQCEAHCILAKRIEPVAIGRLERFVGDHAPAARVEPRVGDRGRVAVVGSGPSGLACAADLARAGVEVTVYEALHTAGGVLRYGIPSFRLPDAIIARELAVLESLGVKIVPNKIIGQTFTVAQLIDEMGFDAVYLGVGAGSPVFLGIDGEQAKQVYSANELLTRVNLMGGATFPVSDTPVPVGKRVVVLGAGNTAMDSARVARRLGADEVHVVYRRSATEAPARQEEQRHAREEGVRFHFLRSPLRIETDDAANVVALVTQVMELGPPDESGRARPQPVADQTERIACDTVVYALGTRANPIVGRSTPGLSMTDRGYIEADTVSQATALPGVFAGGDIVTGGATVVLALGAGRRAARGVLQFLEDRQWPPHLDAEPVARDGHACPRCGRPQDDDASAYVCCAGELLHWRCKGCHQVSEGFAMPYGLCPRCGGELERIEAGDHGGAIEAVRDAFAVELGGMQLYERLASETQDETLTALFENLAAQEREHLEQLRRRYHLAIPEQAEAIALGPLARHANVPPPKDAAECLRLAIALETDARNFFARRADEQEDGSTRWRLYKSLEAEEWQHVAQLEDALRRLEAGQPWLF